MPGGGSQIFSLVVEPPLWKICSSKWESSPNRVENKKWNHHPVDFGTTTTDKNKIEHIFWDSFQQLLIAPDVSIWNLKQRSTVSPTSLSESLTVAPVQRTVGPAAHP